MDWDHGHGFWTIGRRGGFGGRMHGRGAWSEFMQDPAPRADRGVVRYLVLDAIEKQARHGYEIMQTITERSSGSYKPSPGVIYPTLQMLEEIGHVRGVESEARRVYSITDSGRKDLDENREDVADFYERSGDDRYEDLAVQFGELTSHVAKLFKHFKRAARRGRLRPSTMKALRGVLDEAMRKIEAILGDED